MERKTSGGTVGRRDTDRLQRSGQLFRVKTVKCTTTTTTSIKHYLRTRIACRHGNPTAPCENRLACRTAKNRVHGWSLKTYVPAEGLRSCLPGGFVYGKKRREPSGPNDNYASPILTRRPDAIRTDSRVCWSTKFPAYDSSKTGTGFFVFGLRK